MENDVSNNWHVFTQYVQSLKIPSFSKALKVAKENPKMFIVTRWKHPSLGALTLIGYRRSFHPLFVSEPWTRNLRGIIYDANGNVIALPLHKFFNVGERTHVKPQKMLYITEKVDGTMIQVTSPNGKDIIVGTQRQLDEQKSEYIALAKTFIDDKLKSVILKNPRKTFVFELINPRMPIAVTYTGEPRLKLLSIRDVSTGVYLKPETVKTKAQEAGVEFIEMYHLTSEGVEEFLRTASNHEGFVIYDAELGIVKWKTDWYFQKHLAISQSKKNGSLFTRWMCFFIKGFEDDYLSEVFNSQNTQVYELNLKYRSLVEILSLLLQDAIEKAFDTVSSPNNITNNELKVVVSGYQLSPFWENKLQEAIRISLKNVSYKKITQKHLKYLPPGDCQKIRAVKDRNDTLLIFSPWLEVLKYGPEQTFIDELLLWASEHTTWFIPHEVLTGIDKEDNDNHDHIDDITCPTIIATMATPSRLNRDDINTNEKTLN